MGKKERSAEIPTIIGHGAFFEGNITSASGLRIEGRVRGKVKCDHSVVVGHTAKVEAEIESQSVLIDGEVIGNVTAKDQIEITQRGRLRGDIQTPKLVTEPGAHFDGVCKMTSQGSEKEVDDQIEASSPPGMKVVRSKA
jgi:cytoskeletal protein CcmA (bactofilin family)